MGCATGTKASGLLMTASGASTNTLEQIAEAIGPGPKWFQIYMPADRGEAGELMQRVRAAGYTAVVFTVDALGAGNSESLQRTGFPTGRALQAASARLTAGRGARTTSAGRRSAPTAGTTWNSSRRPRACRCC